MELTKKDLDHFQESLLEQKNGLEKELKALENDTDFGDDVDHFEEEADEAEEFANESDVKRRLSEELESVKAALQRLEDGTYGICEKCGKPIEREVLEAAPESTLCKACKKEM